MKTYFIKILTGLVKKIRARMRREIAVFQELSLGVKTLLLGIRRSYYLSFFMATLSFSDRLSFGRMLLKITPAPALDNTLIL